MDGGTIQPIILFSYNLFIPFSIIFGFFFEDVFQFSHLKATDESLSRVLWCILENFTHYLADPRLWWHNTIISHRLIKDFNLLIRVKHMLIILAH